ncbi:hypothetical protein A2U01_0002274 [Trifolium medium]|uniref:Reverse transcriptase zinc-binding domain-containing protein n=1 Tax=Trifolium medium TaxID=97028 RepID=A0A392M2I7_9FABA|nr:hypothetical protein [Trifolium medium]
MTNISFITQLIESLCDIQFSTTKDDWRWRHELGGVFSIKSAYLILDKRARVWDSWTSPKVIVFSWQLLQDRVPTRQNLHRRMVLVGTTDTLCVFFGAVEESVDHFFVHLIGFLRFDIPLLGGYDRVCVPE